MPMDAFETVFGNVLRVFGFPNGQQRRFTYDNQDRLTNITNTSPSGATIASFDYGYDFDWPTNSYSKRGQRTSVTVIAPGASNIVAGLTKYTYDNRYQLIRADYPNNSFDAWTYDAIGNRLSNPSSTAARPSRTPTSPTPPAATPSASAMTAGMTSPTTPTATSLLPLHNTGPLYTAGITATA